MENKKYKALPISQWKESERPREKMFSEGAVALSDSELVAILLRSGDTGCSAVDLSRSLLGKAGNSLKRLASLSAGELMSVSGVGEAKAAAILAAAEIAVRISSEPAEEKPCIRSSAAAARILSPLLKNLSHEECWVLYLNRDGRLVAKEKVSSGGLNSTIIDTRIIVKKSLEKLASSIILAHNHPSGNPYPGEADKRNTEALRDAAALFDIVLADHVIVAGEKYYSFTDEMAAGL